MQIEPTEFELFDETWQSAIDELHRESERGAAIVGAAYLDELIGEVLSEYLLEKPDAFNDLLSSDNQNAPLGNFGARLTAANAIGLITEEELQTFRKVKKIRNRFAHNLSLSFESDDITQLCGQLQLPKEAAKRVGDHPSSRQRYVNAVAFLSGSLKVKRHMIKKLCVRGAFSNVLQLLKGTQGGKTVV